MRQLNLKEPFVIVTHSQFTSLHFKTGLFKVVIFLMCSMYCLPWKAEAVEEVTEWPKHFQEEGHTRYYRCRNIGKYPLNYDCKRFHICTLPNMFTIELFTCQEGKMLDLESQKCVDEKMAVCRRKPTNGTTTTTTDSLPGNTDTTTETTEAIHEENKTVMSVLEPTVTKSGKVEAVTALPPLLNHKTSTPSLTSKDPLGDGTENNTEESVSAGSVDKTPVEENNHQSESVSRSSHDSESSTSEASNK